MFISIKSSWSHEPAQFSDHSDQHHHKATSQYAEVAIKKRPDFPVVYFTLAPDAASVSFGYGASSTSISDEFLHCTVSAQGSVVIRRDAMATLPLFYSVLNGRLLVCNTYHELVQMLPRATLSVYSLKRALSDGARSIPPHNEVQILHAQQILHFHEGKVTILQDEVLLEDTRQAAPTEARQFARKYADYLDYFIASRLQGQTVAFEVSGGLDSATLPQYASLRHQIQPYFSIIFLADPTYYKSQYAKVSALTQKLNAAASAYQLDYGTDFPLARMIKTNSYYLPYGEATYHEVMCAHIEQLVSAGVSVVCTGHGGDEFFGNHVTQGSIFRGMPRSTQVVKLYNNAYIEQGIWPVSPFMDPVMFAWTQGLPLHVRYDRKIMRAFHKAHGFMEAIYDPYLREDFDTFLPDCMVTGKYETSMRHLTDQSALQKLGLADADQMLEKYNRVKNKKHSTDKDWIDDAGKVYWWMLTEITARSILQESSL